MRIPKIVTALSFAGLGFGSIIVYREYSGLSCPKYVADHKLLGRTVIVTGANTGIGKETAKELARRGARVILACRDVDKGEKARAEIVLETANRNVAVKELDLASLESIRIFAENIKKNEMRLDVLVNNAAVMRCPRSYTKDGFETQFGVNHLGHFLLTHLLLNKLRSNSPSRVIVLGSDAHRRGHVNFEDLNCAKDYSRSAAYEQSKLANLLFSHELNKRLHDSSVTVNTVNPGLVRTDLTRHMGVYTSSLGILSRPLLRLFTQSPIQGSQTVVYAAVDPDLTRVSGKYFKNLREETPSAKATNDADSRRLWAISERWVRLEANECLPAPTTQQPNSETSTTQSSANSKQ